MHPHDRPILTLEPFRRLANWGAVLAAVSASVWLAVTPSYSTVSTTISSDGGHTYAEGSATLPEANGPWAYVVLLFPVLVAALPLVFARQRVYGRAAGISAALLLVFVVLASASVGGAYVPAAALTLLAAALARATRPAT